MPNPPAATPHISDVTSDNLYQDETPFPVARCPLLPGAPGLVVRCSLFVAPRIRVIRLESLPRARRGGPSYPTRKPVAFAIADTRRTHKSVCSLLVERGSLAIFSWCSQAIASMLRKRQQTRPLIAILPDLATRVNGFHQNCISICAGLILPEDARQSKAHEDFWRDH